MSSQKASAKKAAAPRAGARAPSRRRGRDRVAALLEAARAVFVEKGTEAATMTEIAARAGAAIGSLYQFFPTKEALAEALHGEVAEAMVAALEALRRDVAARGRHSDAGVLADRLFRMTVDFLDTHPVFVALADRPSIDPKRKQAVRRRLRGEVAAILALAEPKIAAPRIEAIAVLIPHFMRVIVALRSEPELSNRARVIDELRAMLVAHLGSKPLGQKANGRD